MRSAGTIWKQLQTLLQPNTDDGKIGVFWWNERVNFGDQLTPELLSSYGYTPVHRHPLAHRTKDWTMIGSVIRMLPRNYKGNILGSGLIRKEEYYLPNARIWSVRGELTKNAMGLPSATPTGDLGLLSDRLLQQHHEKTYLIGLIPHYVDKDNGWIKDFLKKYEGYVLLIDVERPARAVVEDISRCEMIASSSLHGLIVADSLGLPNLWLTISSGLVGGTFKFYDYFSSIGVQRTRTSCVNITKLQDLEKKMSTTNTLHIRQKKLELENLLLSALGPPSKPFHRGFD